MHNPRPHGLGSVGGALTEEDSAAIELLARRLTNLKNASGVDSLRMVRALPDGGYVIAQDMGGVFKTITHKPVPDEMQPPFDGIATEYIPMLFSGVVTRPMVGAGEGVQIKLTEQARKRISGYSSKDEKMPKKDVSLIRFTIEYHHQVSEFKPYPPPMGTQSQYTKQKPTWYSGAMAEVMQIVGGYGRQDLEALPDDPVERARMLLPEKVLRKIRLKLNNLRLPGYTGTPRKNGQYLYDYKIINTHAVSFDSDGKPWLIQVDKSGVWAMPFPLVPATETAEFKKYVTDKSDDELIAIIERFGGMPSGESFPILADDFQSWRRAGVIIKVCDVADFYQHAMYSSACGWSFNLNGTEGFNTCYDYEDSGIGVGLAYKMKLSLGPAKDGGKLPTSFDLQDDNDARRLDGYLSSLYERLKANKAKELAIKYKVRRVPVLQILARAGGNFNAEAEVEFWDSLELDPIAVHSGSVSQTARGYLHHEASFRNQPQIKFPEPFMDGCVSHDFLPLPHGRGKGKYPNCDTIMFGYYAGNELKTIKYFKDDAKFYREEENNFDECMIVGSWTSTVTSGGTSIMGHFYTSDMDERGERSETVEITKIKGQDKGYDTKPMFAFDYIFSMVGSIWRNRWYTHHTTKTRSGGNSLNLAVCIPFLSRNSVIHAKVESNSGTSGSESMSLQSVTDPNTYRMFTYDFIYAWVGGSYQGNQETAEEIEPYPVDGNPVWVRGYSHSPSTCSDFADQGNWLGNLPIDMTWLVHPSRYEWNTSGGGGPPAFTPTSSSWSKPGSEDGDLYGFVNNSKLKIHSEPPSEAYFIGSPVGDSAFYVDMTANCYGETEYFNFSELEKYSTKRRFFGYSSLVDHKAAHSFIGVINE